MKKFAIVFLALAAAVSTFADYKFAVPENRSVVTVNTDASVTVAYSITFANQGQPIDIIDVGFPDGDYASVTADLDGTEMTDIRPSTAVATGVEVHLEANAIPAGHSGTLHLTALLKNRVFQDDKDPAYASLVFSPTWYGSEYTTGTAHLICEFVFPGGVGPDEPRYHGLQFSSARVEDDRVHYLWDIPQGSPSSQYTFGASFPKRVMEHLARNPRGRAPSHALPEPLAASSQDPSSASVPSPSWACSSGASSRAGGGACNTCPPPWGWRAPRSGGVSPYPRWPC